MTAQTVLGRSPPGTMGFIKAQLMGEGDQHVVKHYANSKTRVLAHGQSGYKHMHTQSGRQVQVGLWDLLASHSSPTWLSQKASWTSSETQDLKLTSCRHTHANIHRCACTHRHMDTHVHAYINTIVQTTRPYIAKFTDLPSDSSSRGRKKEFQGRHHGVLNK